MCRKGVLYVGLGLIASWVALPCPDSLGMPQGSPVNPAALQSRRPSAPLRSPTIARHLGDLAGELASDTVGSGGQLDCAMIFLEAARQLDRSSDDIQHRLLELANNWPERDYSALVHMWLQQTDARSDDIALVKDSIGYLVSRMRSPREREQYLETILGHVHGRSPLLDSYLQTELGLLMIAQNNRPAAERYLSEAYRDHLYNKIAFAKLAELLPDKITEEMYFEHLRFVVVENPLDIDAALAFARYAEFLQLFDLAAGAYKYCVELYDYLYPDKSLPERIYLPWAICNYNVKANRHVVTQIATRVRKTGEFNIFLEAMAGRAAQGLGDEAAARRIFEAAEQKAAQLNAHGAGSAALSQSKQRPSQTLGPMQLAWYYCFARPDKDKAVEWANLAYSTDPNSEAHESILAYALVLNEQWKWAKPIAEKHDLQIPLLALAMIQRHEGAEAAAIETLNRSIAKDPGSLAAERAKELLLRQGARYQPPAKASKVLSSLAERFGESIVPRFTPPEKLVALQFEIPQQRISYGQGIQGIVTLINRAEEAMVVSTAGLVRGAIRIDALVEGDLQVACPKLVSKKLFTDNLIPGDSGLAKSVRLDVGALGRLLQAHPQARLDIKFTLYLDPVAADPNTVKNRITSIEPVVAATQRPKVRISRDSLNQQYSSIALADLTRRMETAALFVGLLKELQEVSRRGDAPYAISYADWMPGRLQSALTSESGLLLYRTFGEWEAKAQVLIALRNLELSADLTQAVARHMNNPYWPVRLIATYLLAQSQGRAFHDVLDYQVRHESNRLVRDLAQALKAGAYPRMAPIFRSGGP